MKKLDTIVWDGIYVNNQNATGGLRINDIRYKVIDTETDRNETCIDVTRTLELFINCHIVWLSYRTKRCVNPHQCCVEPCNKNQVIKFNVRTVAGRSKFTAPVNIAWLRNIVEITPVEARQTAYTLRWNHVDEWKLTLKYKHFVFNFFANESQKGGIPIMRLRIE